MGEHGSVTLTRKYMCQLGKKQATNDASTRQRIIQRHSELQLESAGLQQLWPETGKREDIEGFITDQQIADNLME